MKINKTNKSVRVWTWWNRAWVRVTVTDGQPVTLHRSWNNGEGVSWEGEKYTYDAAVGVVTCERGHGGNDCDGRTVSTGSQWAYADSVGGGDVPTNPDWQTGEPEACVDSFAEAAGY